MCQCLQCQTNLLQLLPCWRARSHRGSACRHASCTHHALEKSSRSVLMPGPDAVLSVSSIALKTAMPARHRQGPGSPERTIPILLPNFPQILQMGMHTSCMLWDEPQTGPIVRSWMNILAGQHMLPTSTAKACISQGGGWKQQSVRRQASPAATWQWAEHSGPAC